MPSLTEWFSQLLYHEKAISLTIVDSDIVNLVQRMHEIYLEHSHGYFGPMKELTASREKYGRTTPMHSGPEPDNGAVKVGDYAI